MSGVIIGELLCPVPGVVSSHCLKHNDNVQLLDREATLLGTGKCPHYNYVSRMNRASGRQADYWGDGQ